MKNSILQWTNLKNSFQQLNEKNISLPEAEWLVPFFAAHLPLEKPVLFFNFQVSTKVQQQWHQFIEEKKMVLATHWSWEVYQQLQFQLPAFECFYQLLHLTQVSNSLEHSFQPFIFLHPSIQERKFPKLSLFTSELLKLKVGENYPKDELEHYLKSLGLMPGVMGELEVGQFSFRSETLQLVLPGIGAYRLIFFDEELESILVLDRKTLRPNYELKEKISELSIFPMPSFFATKERTDRLAEILSKQSTLLTNAPRQRMRIEARQLLMQKISNNKNLFFQYFDVWTLLFSSEELCTFHEFAKELQAVTVGLEKDKKILGQLLEKERELYSAQLESDGPNLLLPSLEHFFRTQQEGTSGVGVGQISVTEPLDSSHSRPLLPLIKEFALEHRSANVSDMGKQAKLQSSFEGLLLWLKSKQEELDDVYITLVETDGKNLSQVLTQRLKVVLKNTALHFTDLPLGPSRYLEVEASAIISAVDFFPKFHSEESDKKNSEQKGQKAMGQDLFAQHMSNMQIGDYIVHQTYGIGKYLGMNKIAQQGSEMDFITLGFLGDDKIYLPVYKINLIQRYAAAASHVALASLRSPKFEQQKKLARESAKALAFDLIKLEAERQIHKRDSLTPPGDLYRQFERSFPYQETPDQFHAIEEILKDLASEHTMDRLVCGDVGFGKTEVAMRAAFKMLEDNKQVVVLVPTTILCMQHTKNFKERMKDMSINISSFSRFQSPKESKDILEKFNAGKIDILIATHKVLTSKVSAANLGLVIVDEEHRFGVADKEKLKLLRASTDFLTLTATPIPRTLQQSFLGIKKISLIQTPPSLRLSVKCLMIGNDEITIKKAILEELKRKGQIFFVHNRVEDIESIHFWLKSLIPELRLVVAHGQMPVKELEKRITDFFEYRYDLLLATTIIESGIDIPKANTLIINDAHHFGLAQLHQLRGRIGRSDQQAYCYFVVPQQQILGEIQTKRLEAIMKYTELGSGFHLANSDLEIRGAGELLGANQSGHITSVGLELYMELLQEAVSELKGEVAPLNQNLDIQLGLECFLPDHYIENSGVRLKYYKALANAFSRKDLAALKEELIDIYGPMPLASENLLCTLEIRNLLGPKGIQQMTLNRERLTIKFDAQFMERFPQKAQDIVQYFLKRPKKYRFTDSYTVGFDFQVRPNAQEVLEWALLLQQELI